MSKIERKGWMDILMGGQRVFMGRARRQLEDAIVALGRCATTVADLPDDFDLQSKSTAHEALMDLIGECGRKIAALDERERDDGQYADRRPITTKQAPGAHNAYR